MESKKILIVDDVTINIDILNEILKGKYEILTATNGPDALKIAGSEDPPDLILLDIIMPEMDGHQVLEKLRNDDRTRSIPVVFITTKDEMEDRMKGFDLGVEYYITKPVDPVYVTDIVDKLLNLS